MLHVTQKQQSIGGTRIVVKENTLKEQIIIIIIVIIIIIIIIIIRRRRRRIRIRIRIRIINNFIYRG